MSQGIEIFGAINLQLSKNSGTRHPLTRVYEYCLLRCCITPGMEAGSPARIPPTEAKTNTKYDQDMLQTHLN
jgi:hypothetical protein